MKKMLLLMMATVIAVAFAGIGFAAGPKDFELKTVGDEGKVTFSHSAHLARKAGEEQIACKSCHPGLFKMKKGGDDIKMATMKEGKQCGACHNGKIAFDTTSPDNCPKCHKK